MKKIEKNSLVMLSFTGRVNGKIFDTNIKSDAEKEGIKIDREGPTPVVIGKGMIIKGLEEFLIGKTIGSYNVKIPKEKAFGEKNPELVTIIKQDKFLEQGIKPYPGLVLNIDGFIGTVKSVGSGRVIVDFNHPLAGRDVEYFIEVKEIINDDKEKVLKILKLKNLAVKKEEEEAIIIDNDKLIIKKEGIESLKKLKDEELKSLVEILKTFTDKEVVIN